MSAWYFNMNTAAIKSLPKIRRALSNSFSEFISDNISYEKCKSNIVNYYSSFIYVIGNENYSGLDILNDENKLSEHLHQFLGFIYSVLPTNSPYSSASIAVKLFSSIAEDKQLSIDTPKIFKITNSQIQSYISVFNELKPCKKRLNYLNGWQVKSKDSEIFNFNIGKFHDTFGDVITSKIYGAVCNYGLTLWSKTLLIKLKTLTYLLNAFSEQCNSARELEINLDAMNSYSFFERVMWSMFTKVNLSGRQPKRFFTDWSNTVIIFTQCFIDTGIFDEPIYPILTPEFREDSQPIAKLSQGGKLSASEEKLWLANIPLHIKDEQVINDIENRLRVSEEHVRSAFHEQLLIIQKRHDRNSNLLKTGRIKTELHKNLLNSKKVQMGKSHISNVVTTFNFYGINSYLSDYFSFLKGHGTNTLTSDELQAELNLPSTDTLGALCTLLVLEHPSLTPSTLEAWELYNSQGEQVGYKSSGNGEVIVVNKKRKGINDAEQVIPLNEYSQAIVQTIITHTKFARDYLKANPSTKLVKKSDWRKMLIIADYSKAEWQSRFAKNVLNKGSKSFYRRWIAEYSNNLLSDSDKSLLSLTISFRSARRLRAIRIYIQTRSLKAVSEALGHKEVDMPLLSRYLPESLISFFNARWIRQFQNALVYHAMKDSEYLFESIDIKPEYLEEFLKNHRINDIPALFEKFKTTSENNLLNSALTEQPEFDEVTFTVTTPLLQILIAIKTIVDESKLKANKDVFKDIVSTWYEAATFLLTDLDLESRENKERQAMLDRAKQNPLDIAYFRRALLC